tara:strand:- start:4590 stop:5432 length:843 start_codon:yes stop_codon:yes gene_type:complete
MSSITVVTTFHKPGLEIYGQRFIDSFAAKVDKSIKLIVYAEGCTPINPDLGQIFIQDAYEALPKLNAFKERWKDVPKANGDISTDPVRSRRKDSNKLFKWDAVRFANKVYAVLDACNKREGNWIVWMDADSYIHSDWSYKAFKVLLPENKYITYVGRGKGSQTWPECGFYGLNMNHPVCHSFLQEFERMYEDADNGMFLLPEWHDSYIFGEVLKQFKEFNADHDYSAQMYMREAKSGGGGHPLINTELGKYMDHMKGERKKAGKSKPSDIMVNRPEEYWK